MMETRSARGGGYGGSRDLWIAEALGPHRTLDGAWRRLQQIATQAINRRMTTEMSDLASRIQKYHDARNLER